MEAGKIELGFNMYTSLDELPANDQLLIQRAKDLAKSAYAPYSGFKVAAVALMSDGTLVNGTNQENASYPIGLCAERVLLAAVSSIAPGMSILTMAITYESDEVETVAPVAPCGMCRQSLLEFESRFNHPMRVLLAGELQVYEFESASLFLPLGFKPQHLGK